MAAPALPKLGFDISDSYGSAMLGLAAAFAVWGMTCAQTFTYYLTPHGDGALVKLMVALLWALDTTQIMLCVKGLWDILIKFYGSKETLAQLHTEEFVQLYPFACIAFIAQAYLSWKVVRGTRNQNLYYSMIMVVSVWLFATNIVYTTKGLVDGTLGGIQEGTILALNYTLQVGYTVMGIILAGILGFCAVKDRLDLEIHRNAWAQWSVLPVATGGWIALMSLLSFFLFVTRPKELIYTAAFLPLGAIYHGTVLAHLNGRVSSGSVHGGSTGVSAGDSTQQHAVSFPSSQRQGSGIPLKPMGTPSFEMATTAISSEGKPGQYDDLYREDSTYYGRANGAKHAV